ncbi:hypothetical protein Bca52824_033187 [Brassica carinata]|uniref:Uncharacterized protein n=1 Tax=Brassica carinata TaxID=52824 RepID=A0A8X7V985_BRACI|nr:hypothetical protein Bca52824_033187 [Brassica carinata]
MAELGRVSSRTPEDDDGFSLGRMFSGSLSQPYTCEVRMANFTLMFSDLKEGRRSTTVEIRLRFWESRSLQISRFCIKNYVTGFKDLEPVIWICLLFGEPRLARTTTTAADGFAIFGGIFFQRGAVEGVSIQPGTRLMILDHLYVSDNPRLS